MKTELMALAAVALTLSGCGTSSQIDVRGKDGSCYRVTKYTNGETRVDMVRDQSDPTIYGNELTTCRAAPSARATQEQ